MGVDGSQEVADPTRTGGCVLILPMLRCTNNLTAVQEMDIPRIASISIVLGLAIWRMAQVKEANAQLARTLAEARYSAAVTGAH